MSGVIPPIFASSIILLPATLAQFFHKLKGWDGYLMLEWHYHQVNPYI